jgi:hypothetical protein
MQADFPVNAHYRPGSGAAGGDQLSLATFATRLRGDIIIDFRLLLRRGLATG